MAKYINGVIVKVKKPVQSKSGNSWYQEVYMQHEWDYKNPEYNKYITFSVISTEKNKRISTFNLKEGDDVEVALDINAMESADGRWFNFITCFGVERNQKLWHNYERPKREAVVPTSMQTQEHALEQNAAVPAPATAQPAVAVPTIPAQPAPSAAQEPDDLPF